LQNKFIYYFCADLITYHSHQIIKKMKKIAYLFVAFALFGVVALGSCKSKTAEPAVEETVVEEAPVAAPDTVVADTAAMVQ
jgi:hypothetical protein